MLIIRYKDSEAAKLAAVTEEGKIVALPQQDFLALVKEAKQRQLSPLQLVEQMIADAKANAQASGQAVFLEQRLDELHLLKPHEAQEVWASGVTYSRSREARNYETSKAEQEAKTFYDKVYDAKRPELFLKSSPLRSVGPNEPLSLRSDSNWQVPEPELGLVLDDTGQILGYTIGNDMSCRDIEGDNPLYLPQAKTWKRSCAYGPAIRLAETVQDPYALQITCSIYRNDEKVFSDDVSTGQLKRKYEELVSYLLQDNVIYDGTILLTGTGIVPPNDFTLKSGDRIDIAISGIGVLSNTVE